MSADVRMRKTESFLELIAPYLPPALEEIDVPSYVLDSNGRIRWLNRAAREIVGDAVGRPFTSVVEPSDIGRARSRFAKGMRGETLGEFAVDVRTADGKEQPLEISSVPLRAGHRAIGMFGLGRRMRAPRRPEPTADADVRLTHRQREILGQLALGASTDQIAASFHLSRETVRNHIRHILKRLDARSRLEAVAVARRDGII